MMGIRLQDWPYIGIALSKHNSMIKSSIYRVNRETSLDKLPLFQIHSIHAMNGFQPTCNAFTRHSNDMKIYKTLAFKCN